MTTPTRQEALETAVRLGLVSPCPDCQATGAPTLAANAAGEALELECDCAGVGYNPTREGRRAMLAAFRLLRAAEAHGLDPAFLAGSGLVVLLEVLTYPAEPTQPPRSPQ